MGKNIFHHTLGLADHSVQIGEIDVLRISKWHRIPSKSGKDGIFFKIVKTANNVAKVEDFGQKTFFTPF